MIRQRYQRITNDPERSDCFATCVAMILDLDDVPNFQAAGPGWWRRLQEWLSRRNLLAVEVRLPPEGRSVTAMTPGVPVILSGKSPRGDWPHAVVGLTRWDDGFEFAHDPHPAGGWLDGPVQRVTFFAALRPDRTARASP
jgi:hypothetical protein